MKTPSYLEWSLVLNTGVFQAGANGPYMLALFGHAFPLAWVIGAACFWGGAALLLVGIILLRTQ